MVDVSDGTKVIFVPLVKSEAMTSERSPMMLQKLSFRFKVIPIPRSRFSSMIYDQRYPRSLRYCLFPLDVATIFLRTAREARKPGSAVIFGEGTYFTLAGGMAGHINDQPVVWDNHGNIWEFAAAQGKSGWFIRANELLERALSRICSKVLVVSEHERRIYATHGLRSERFEVIPTCIDMQEFRNRMRARVEARSALGIKEEEAVILFFGTLSYRPNREAAEFIERELAPRTRAKHPNARFYIVGGGGAKGEVSNACLYMGFQPDLHLWLSACDVCIAPLWSGVGILTKVLDMLAAARPTIVTELALEGIPELQGGKNCMVARNKDEFAMLLGSCLEDSALGERISKAGQQLVQERYSWEVMGPKLFALVAALGDERAPDVPRHQ